MKILTILAIALAASVNAQNLDRVPKIWEEPAPHRLTEAEYEATLKFWDEKYGAMLEVRGKHERSGSLYDYDHRSQISC